MKPIIEAAGKDISHWFDERTKEVRNCIVISLDNSLKQKSNNSNALQFSLPAPQIHRPPDQHLIHLRPSRPVRPRSSPVPFL